MNIKGSIERLVSIDPLFIEEVDNMSVEEFLIKLKLIINGKITNAAMLLLGNEDRDYLFASAFGVDIG